MNCFLNCDIFSYSLNILESIPSLNKRSLFHISCCQYFTLYWKCIVIENMNLWSNLSYLSISTMQVKLTCQSWFFDFIKFLNNNQFCLKLLTWTSSVVHMTLFLIKFSFCWKILLFNFLILLTLIILEIKRSERYELGLKRLDHRYCCF